jgi:ribosome-binding protein aMBF1 (putative translation factor)
MILQLLRLKGIDMDNQDWELVTVRRSKNSAATKEKSASAPAPHYSPTATASRKLADATDVGKHKHLTSESRHTIIALRATNTWTQVQLNQKCAFPPNTIRDIEAGKVTPSIGQLNALNRVLKCGLRLE